jgi:hypothetical protein
VALSLLTPTFQPPQHILQISFAADEVIHISTDESSVRKKTTQWLLDSAIGSLTPHDWHHAEGTISWWTRQRTRDSVDPAWRILDRLIEEEKSHPMRDPLQRTNMTDWLNWIVNTWRQLVEIETAHTDKGSDCLTGANEVLERLDCYKPFMVPYVQTYSMIVDAVMIQGVDCSAATLFVEWVLEQMYQEAEVNPLVLPDIIMYNSVINVWAKSELPEGPKKAEETFQRMERFGLNPTISFTVVIAAWASSGTLVMANQAESILHQMLELYQASNPDIKLNAVTFNSVIHAWVNSGECCEEGSISRMVIVVSDTTVVY